MPETRTQTRPTAEERHKNADNVPAEAQETTGDQSETPDEQAEARGELAPEPPEIVHPSPFEMPDRYSTKSLDRAANAHLARFTLGVTPYGMASTFFSWGAHL